MPAIHNKRIGRKPTQQELESRKVYCPNYDDYSRWSRVDLKKRDMEHSLERKRVFEYCVYASLDALMKIFLFHFGEKLYTQYLNHRNKYHLCSKCSDINCKPHSPQKCVNCEISYEINPALMENLLQVSEKSREQWSGLQISQCKKRMIENYQKFHSKEVNHQDQNSWQCIANYLYVPAIESALKKFNSFVDSLPTKIKEVLNGPSLRHAIFEQLSCGLVYFMMDFTTKFKRTKPKPLVRARTLFRSKELRVCFLKCNAEITVDRWIAEEKIKQSEKRRDTNGKLLNRNVCEEVHHRTKHQCLILYETKLRTVCSLLDIQLPVGFIDDILHGKQQSSNKNGKQKKRPKNIRGRIVENPVIIGEKINRKVRKPPMFSYMNKFPLINCNSREFQSTNDFVFSGQEKRHAMQMNYRRNCRQAIMHGYGQQMKDNNKHTIIHNKSFYKNVDDNRSLKNQLLSNTGTSWMMSRNEEKEEMLLSDECSIPEMASVSLFTDVNSDTNVIGDQEMTEIQKRRLLSENKFLRKTIADASQFLCNIQMYTDMNKFLPSNSLKFSHKLPFPSLFSSSTPAFVPNESCEQEIALQPMPTLSKSDGQNGEYGMDFFGSTFDQQSLNNDMSNTVPLVSVGNNDGGSIGSSYSSSPMSARLNNDFMINGSVDDRDFNDSTFMNMMDSLPPIVNENNIGFGSIAADDFLESF